MDAREFERLDARARDLMELGEPDRATYALEQALGLWRGPALVELEYSPDGTRLAVSLLTVDRQMIRVIDTETYEPVAEQPGGQPRYAHPQDSAFSPDGRYLAVGVVVLERGFPGEHLLHVWDLTRPRRPLHAIDLPSDSFHVEFSADGRLLHTAPSFNSDAYPKTDTDPGRWTYSTRTGKLVDTSPHGGQGLVPSEDGHLLA